MLVEWARSHDAPSVERWDFGHNTPTLSAALSQLKIGEVARDPVRVPYYFVVPMRLNPDLSGQEPALSFELPSPRMADLEAIVRGTESKALLSAIAQLRTALAEFGLDQHEHTIAERTIARFGSELSSAKTPDERARAMHATLRALYAEVPEASYARIRLLIEHAATTLLMQDAA